MFARTLAAVAASALLLATPAFAQAEPVSVQVQIGDLDLASAAGQSQLHRRVHRAATAICGDAQNNRAFLDAFARCREDVFADADDKIEALTTGVKRIQVARRMR